MSLKIKSKFKRNEQFSLDNIPKHFDSVTDSSIRKVKDYCAASIGRKYHGEYNPQSLKSMLETIFGEFDYVYAELEGDYQTRLSNLQTAHQEGLADVQADIINFRNQVDQHNDLYERYAIATERVTGRRPSKQLAFRDDQLRQFEAQYEELRRKA